MNMKNKRIVFVISSLSSGGAERVISIIANYFAYKKYQVAIVTFYHKTHDWYPLNKDVVRIVTGYTRGQKKLDIIRNYFKKILRLRKIFIELNPDVIISFLTEVNIITLLAAFRLGTKVIISERVDPTLHKTILPIWKWLRRLTYPRADYLVVQTKRVCDYYSEWPGLKIAIVPNPVLSPEKIRDVRMILKKPFIVAMGRLTFQKGFDLLIESFSKLAKKYPKWNLVVIGEGEKRRELEQLISHFGLNSRISLIGKVKNPQTILRQADIFVLSSLFEGFPNALLEAMACGLPVISFNCPSGPAEIIRYNYDGILVPPENINVLSLAMDKLISDKLLRQKLGENAKQVTKRFSVEKIMEQWERLFD